MLKLNPQEFPQAGSVWDSLAEEYVKAGDLKNAEESYEKSLILDANNENAKEMLGKIMESKKD